MLGKTDNKLLRRVYKDWQDSRWAHTFENVMAFTYINGKRQTNSAKKLAKLGVVALVNKRTWTWGEDDYDVVLSDPSKASELIGETEAKAIRQKSREENKK
jgi:hypothetical protein